MNKRKQKHSLHQMLKHIEHAEERRRRYEKRKALCEAKGIEREVSLFMLQGEEVAPGDHVLVHVGYAIQKVSEEDARLAWELFDEIEHA